MCEAKRASKKTKVDPDSEYQCAILQINTLYECTEQELSSGVQLLEDFRSELSADLIDIMQRIDTLKAKVKKYAEHVIVGKPLLGKGSKFYTKKLRIKVGEIMDGIEEEFKPFK
jgi:hypothetical protein